MKKNSENPYIPYRKSYYTKKTPSISGWTPAVSPRSPVNALNIFTPYSVNSLREMNLSPRYPKIEKSPTLNLPLIPKSASHSFYSHTPNNNSRIFLNKDHSFNNYIYQNELPYSKRIVSGKQSQNYENFEGNSDIYYGFREEYFENDPKTSEKNGISRNYGNLIPVSQGKEGNDLKTHQNLELSPKNNGKTHGNNLGDVIASKKNFENHSFEIVNNLEKNDKSKKDESNVLEMSPEKILSAKNSKNLLYWTGPWESQEKVEKNIEDKGLNMSRLSLESKFSEISMPKIFIQSENGKIENVFNEGNHREQDFDCRSIFSNFSESPDKEVLKISSSNKNEEKSMKPSKLLINSEENKGKFESFNEKLENLLALNSSPEKNKPNLNRNIPKSHENELKKMDNGYKKNDFSDSKSILSGSSENQESSKYTIEDSFSKYQKKNEAEIKKQTKNDPNHSKIGLNNIKFSVKNPNIEIQFEKNIESPENYIEKTHELQEPVNTQKIKKSFLTVDKKETIGNLSLNSSNALENSKSPSKLKKSKTTKKNIPKKLNSSKNIGKSFNEKSKNYEKSISNNQGTPELLNKDSKKVQKSFSKSPAPKIVNQNDQKRLKTQRTSKPKISVNLLSPESEKSESDASEKKRENLRKPLKRRTKKKKKTNLPSEYSEKESVEESQSENYSSINTNSVQTSENESVYLRVNGVDRFINNFSLSMINILNFLVFDLEEQVNIISSDSKTIDLSKLILFKKPADQIEKTKIKIQKKIMIKKMKVELNVIFKQIFHNNSKKINKKSIESLIAKIRKSLVSEGIKDELINYLKSSEKALGKNEIRKVIGKIIKKRLKNSRNFSVEFSESDEDSSSDSFSISSSDDGLKEHRKNLKYRNLDFQRFKYEINHLNTFKFKRNELNKEATVPKTEIFDPKEYKSEEWAFEENEEDINEELSKMNWVNSEKVLKYLFTSPVNYKHVDENVINDYQIDKSDKLEGNIDINNFEALLLKRRFLDLNSIKKKKIPRNEEKYQVMVNDNKNLDLMEMKEIEKNNIKKYIKKTRHSQNKETMNLTERKKVSFTNISRSENTYKNKISKKISLEHLDYKFEFNVDPEKVYLRLRNSKL